MSNAALQQQALEQRYPILLLERTTAEPFERYSSDLNQLLLETKPGQEFMSNEKYKSLVRTQKGATKIHLRVSIHNNSDAPVFYNFNRWATLELRTYDMNNTLDLLRYFSDFHFHSKLATSVQSETLILAARSPDATMLTPGETSVVDFDGILPFDWYFRFYLNMEAGWQTDRVLVLHFLDSKSGLSYKRETWLNMGEMRFTSRQTTPGNR